MLAQAHDIVRYLIVPLFVLAALGLARAVGIGLLRRLERMPSQPPVEPRDTAAADPLFSWRRSPARRFAPHLSGSGASDAPIGEVPEVPNWRRHLSHNDFAFPHGAGAAREADGGRAMPSVLSAVRDPRLLADDPLGRFIAAHVRHDPGGARVTGHAMRKAYEAWCRGQAR